MPCDFTASGCIYQVILRCEIRKFWVAVFYVLGL